MYKFHQKNPLNHYGFSLVELLVVIFIIGILANITSPYAINWLRRQQTISYLTEMKEFIRLVRSEARRWGASCEIALSENNNDNKLIPYKIDCISEDGSVGNIRLIQPTPPNNNFHSLNQKLFINPRGKIVGNSHIIFVFGYKVNEKRKKDSMFCLTLNPVNSLIKEGNFYLKDSESLAVAPFYATNISKMMCN